jgi:hypothetical protein
MRSERHPARRASIHPRRTLLAVVAGCLAGVAPPSLARAQGCGCVAVQNHLTTGLIDADSQGVALAARQWQGSFGFRWYQSNRDFVGDVEQLSGYGRAVNETFSFDLSVSYGITSRWSVTLDAPFNHSHRATSYEHNQSGTYAMTATGFGDLRLTTDVWLLDPHTHRDGNITLGVGLSMPIGDSSATDTAHRAEGPVTRPVDLSIQPGTGGWGVILQIQAYQRIYRGLSAYLNGFYVLTPQEQNGTEYPLADLRSTAAYLTASQTHNSIPDQYLARVGFSQVLWASQGLAASLGCRLEGVAVDDLIGGSMGFRRPGYALSLEPGASWAYRGNSLAVTVPVAVYRNRQQSAPEAALDQLPGHAAFADVSVLARFTRRF